MKLLFLKDKKNQGFKPKLVDSGYFVKNKNSELVRGFTLIEIMVASSLFITIMLTMSGAILSIFDANQKSKNMRSVMDNLNLTLESMTRTIRFGTNYHCGPPEGSSTPLNCFGGSPSITITDVNGNQVTYSTSTTNTMISKTIGVNSYYITSPDVTVTNLKFFVFGADPYCITSCGSTDISQPMVVAVVSGYVGVKQTTRSSFVLQTTISQRAFDFRE